jgi:hypothetical protein
MGDHVRVGHGSLSVFDHCPTFPDEAGGIVARDRMRRATGQPRPLWRNDRGIFSCRMTTADFLRPADEGERGGDRCPRCARNWLKPYIWERCMSSAKGREPPDVELGRMVAGERESGRAVNGER